jgi:hypothetical protein
MSETENKVPNGPEYHIEGKELKITYPKGHFYHNEGYELLIQCEREVAPDDTKALELLKIIGVSLEDA